MIYLETGSINPAINLACEEYFLKQKDLGDAVFQLWQNRPSVVIGRFQNIFAEVNLPFAMDHQIEIIRRISGGGAVYQDLGNLCFSFIIPGITPATLDKPALAQPLVNVLAGLGIRVELTRRNDLLVDGKKFSGNAMALTHHRLLYHGTLLYNTDLEFLTQVLAKPHSHIQSKATPSLRSAVTNLKQYLPGNVDLPQLKKALQQALVGDPPEKEYRLTTEDLNAIQELAAAKYLSWDWNFGSNPRFTLDRTCQRDGASLVIHLEIEKGLIQGCQLSGDFVDAPSLKAIEDHLLHIPYADEDILAAIGDLRPFPFSKEEITRCMMGF